MTRATASGKVLVLGDDTRSFLSVIRSFGRSGLETHVAFCPPNSASLRSRYVSYVHTLPPYRQESKDWLRGLARLLETERFDLVVPCNDSSLLLLHTHRAELQNLPGIRLLHPEVFKICFSKARTYELAQRVSVPVPRQRTVRSLAELEQVVLEFGFPMVLKPLASADLQNPSVRQQVRKVWRREDLSEASSTESLREGLLVQENFIGAGVGVEVLCREGAILTAFQHERVHEPLMGGGSSYRRSAPLDPDLLDATQRLMAVLRYTGVAMVEFKVNQQTGQWTLIEINSRFWGSLPLSIAAGLDFPRYLYEMLLFDRAEFPRRYRTGYYARNWLKDLQWTAQNLRADRSNRALVTRPLANVALDLLNPILLRESSDTLALDDPGPAWAEVTQVWSDRIVPRLKLWFGSRRSLEREAREAVREARQVLFVCKGNICRSPFAEYRLRQSGFAGICESAGFFSTSGRRSPEAAIAAAAKLGIDLKTHRSRVLDEATIEAADVILLFDQENQDKLAALYPDALEKAYFLGAIDRGAPIYISDPYGEDVETFGLTYQRIERLVRSIETEKAPNGRRPIGVRVQREQVRE